MSSEKIEKSLFNNFILKIKQNPKLIFFIFVILILIFAGVFFFQGQAKKKNIFISNQFNQAKILINKKQIEQAKNILVEIIRDKNKFYSPLSLYLIIENNLEEDPKKTLELFDIVISNNKIDDENKNLILIKKGLFFSSLNDEENMLKTLNPIVNSDSAWRVQAIQILGNYFYNKGEKQKSDEYYNLLKTK